MTRNKCSTQSSLPLSLLLFFFKKNVFKPRVAGLEITLETWNNQCLQQWLCHPKREPHLLSHSKYIYWILCQFLCCAERYSDEAVTTVSGMSSPFGIICEEGCTEYWEHPYRWHSTQAWKCAHYSLRRWHVS